MASRFRRARRTFAVSSIVMGMACAGIVVSPSVSGAARRSSPSITLVAITESSPAVLQMLAVVKKCTSLLGWKLNVLNANGTPSLMASDFSSAANGHPTAIIDIAIPPSSAPEGMREAKSKHIPIIGLGAPIIDPQHFLAADYAPSDAHMAKLLARQIKRDMHSKGEALTLPDTTQLAIKIRTATLRKEMKGTTIKVGANPQVTLANPISNTETAVADAIHANRSINMVWGLQDFEFAAAIHTITSQSLGKVGVFSFYLDPVDFGLMRADKGTAIPEAVVDSPVGDSAWYIYDALVNKLILKKKHWKTRMKIHPLPYTLVTPHNVQAHGTTYRYKSFKPFFARRWKKEGVKVHS